MSAPRLYMPVAATLMLLTIPAVRAQGPIGPMGVGAEIKLVKQFDANKDGWLNAAERAKARPSAAAAAARNGGPMGGPPGGRFGGRAGDTQPPTPGAALVPTDVTSFPSTPVYDDATLRTVFLDFENADWEKELQDFHGTDVDVTATLTIDGQRFRDVGVRFRGLSSYMGVPEGRKRSLNVTLDLAHADQAFRGVRTLNLLNSHEDPTFLRAVLYSRIARQFIPAPAANFVRVAINGESWGVYVNAEQFNKDFLQHWYGTTAGVRWKVPGSPGGRGGLEYVGSDAAAYRRTFEIKSKDDPAAWAALIRVCQTLNETPADRLEAALAPILDIDGALRFLALDIALVNGDGYWTRASDYALYLDPKGVLHVVPHDMNEAFASGGPGGGRGPGGPDGRGGRGGFGPPPDGRGFPGFPGGPGGMGPGRGATPSPELDPLTGLDDATKPLRSKLLAVPAWRTTYLRYVREIAQTWLDWSTLGPVAARAQALIAPHVATDTRKLDAFEPASVTLQPFVEKRRAYLLK